MNVNDFQTMHMQTIVGQMPLPQSIFRKFLSWFQSENDSESAQKQDVTDETLETTDKTIVGAINEIKSAVSTVAGVANTAIQPSNFSFDETEGKLSITIGENVFVITAALATDDVTPH